MSSALGEGLKNQPNLRYFSLSEDHNWKMRTSSDNFYPEMIPEPDYSDSGDETRSEDDINLRYTAHSRLAMERLRDLTEVYVSDASPKKTQTKRSPKKQGKQTFLSKQTPSPRTRKVLPKSPAKNPSPNTAKEFQSPEGAIGAELKSKSTAAKPGVRRSPRPAQKTKSVVFAADTREGGGDSRLNGIQEIEKVLLSEPTSSSDEDQLIKPKKPYVLSAERLNLHKELKFSQKYGKLASSKTELQLALERYTENKLRKEQEAEEKSSLEKILEYQAKKIEMQEAMDKCPSWMERLHIASSTSPDPQVEEFYRIHAKVVSSNPLTHCFLPEDGASSSECTSSSNTLALSDSDS